jgi:NAD(P)-dependent dehydrogenase (short-subunit alcohol dehydrogenase family)
MDLTQRLAGKVAVITGGAGGIGLATGRRMHAEGATIVVGDIDPTAGKAAADELDGLFVPVDVSDEAAVNNLFDATADTYGSVDIAFNNAGISPPDDDVIETTELPAWQTVQDINLKSVYLSCRAALRHMVPAKKGSIINTASFVAVMGSATSQISYTASKGGVLAMSGFASTRCAPDRSTPRCCRSCSPRTRSGRRGGWSTCRSAASPSRRNSPPQWRSWPATTRRSSPLRRSWSTAESAPRT